MTKKKPGKRGVEKIVPWYKQSTAVYQQIDGWSLKRSCVNVVTGVVELTLEKIGNTTAMP